VDGEKILRVLVNLLSNAVRYAYSSVWVEVHQQADQVCISVKDDGTGFTQQDLQRLFERFYKGAGEGSGLGMTIAKAIVQGHGGEIRAGNWEQGAQVEFTLPILIEKNRAAT
jgi:signal transduction histidine kinase